MSYGPRKGGTSSRQALGAHPLRVHQSALIPQHLIGRVNGNGPSLKLVSQEQFQHLMMHALSGHVDCTSSSPIVQLQVGPMKEEEPGCIIATMDGCKEESCLALPGKKNMCDYFLFVYQGNC